MSRPIRPGRSSSGARSFAATWACRNYRNNWLQTGFTEADLENGGSNRSEEGDIAARDDTLKALADV